MTAWFSVSRNCIPLFHNVHNACLLEYDPLQRQITCSALSWRGGKQSEAPNGIRSGLNHSLSSPQIYPDNLINENVDKIDMTIRLEKLDRLNVGFRHCCYK